MTLFLTMMSNDKIIASQWYNEFTIQFMTSCLYDNTIYYNIIIIIYDIKMIMMTQQCDYDATILWVTSQ